MEDDPDTIRDSIQSRVVTWKSVPLMIRGLSCDASSLETLVPP